MENNEVYDYWLNRINDYIESEELTNDKDKITAVVRYLIYHATIGGLMDEKKYSLIGKSKEYLKDLSDIWITRFLS